jgi:hypothetical protein
MLGDTSRKDLVLKELTPNAADGSCDYLVFKVASTFDALE